MRSLSPKITSFLWSFLSLPWKSLAFQSDLAVEITSVGCSVLGPYTTNYLISLLGFHFSSE